jgi:molecular chaperone GrpE
MDSGESRTLHKSPMNDILKEQEQQNQQDQADQQPADAQPDPLDALRREKDAVQDRLLRTAAEFDNYRKRVDRERRDLGDYIAAEVVGELLPIIDNLERALDAASETDPLRKGVELTLKQMLEVLRKRGVKPIEALGADFDPNFHQAVIHEASSEHREGEVMEELQRGYLIGERLLRPAMVKVAKAA